MCLYNIIITTINFTLHWLALVCCYFILIKVRICIKKYKPSQCGGGGGETPIISITLHSIELSWVKFPSQKFIILLYASQCPHSLSVDLLDMEHMSVNFSPNYNLLSQVIWNKKYWNTDLSTVFPLAES